MADPHLLNILQEVGLREKEALVYYAALRLGPSSVLALSRHSGVKRSTVYSILESLKDKRLIRREVRGIKEVFTAEGPQSLDFILEERRRTFLEALPQLSALHRLEGAESVIKFYEGLSAVKQIYLDFIRSVKIGDDYLVLADMALWHKLDPEFFDDFVEKRGKLNIRVRMILTHSKRALHRKGPGRRPNERTRILPAGTTLTTNLVIIPTKVLIHQLVPPIMGIVIENQNIIRMHREMYELIWGGLGE
ncbi:MAG: hypothetical protein DCC75_12075 [Proteobacteria bacterium]|nr:MAG: hypothetical protein DCC75_12075 [Pseudomonadota bacterium]